MSIGGTLVDFADSIETLAKLISPKQKKGMWVGVTANTTYKGVAMAQEHLSYILNPWNAYKIYEKIEDRLLFEMNKRGISPEEATVSTMTKLFTKKGEVIDFPEAYFPNYRADFYDAEAAPVKIEPESPNMFLS